MLCDNGEWVVFEGNLGYQRMDAIFLSTAQVWDYIYNFSWPFDKTRQFMPVNKDHPYDFYWVKTPKDHLCYGGGNQELKKDH